MTKSVVVTVPHHATRAEVLARIRKHLPAIKARAAPYVSTIEEQWNGDDLAFAVEAAGQRVAGTIAVEAEAVRIEVALPWVMAAFAGPVGRRLSREATKLLAKS